MNIKLGNVKMIVSIIIAAMLFANSEISVFAAEKYAYSIGTNYGLFDVNTSQDAENASTAFALAGYKSYYNISPDSDYLKGNNPSGTRRVGSSVVLYSGHGNNKCVSFNYKGQGGKYKTGIYYSNFPLKIRA